MSSTTENYDLVMPDATDPVDINVLNNNFRTIDSVIGDLANSTDRVTARAQSTVDQMEWRNRAWANGNVEIWGVRTFNLAKAGSADIMITLPDGYRLVEPYYISAIPSYRGPYTSSSKTTFATKFKAGAPKLYCIPYEISTNQFRLYVWNLTGEATTFDINLQIVGRSQGI